MINSLFSILSEIVNRKKGACDNISEEEIQRIQEEVNRKIRDFNAEERRSKFKIVSGKNKAG